MSRDLEVGRRWTRREVVAGAVGGVLLAGLPRRAWAHEPAVVAKELAELATKVRPMERGCKAAKDALAPVLKLHGDIPVRVKTAWKDQEPDEWTPVHEMGHAWTDLLTLAHYHGAAGKHGYASYRRSVAYRRLDVDFPVSRRWSVVYPTERDAQLSATLEQQHLGKDPARTIKVWYYRWDTTYDGVGGENAQKLAEVMLEVDKEVMVTGKREVSDRVEIKRFNKSFPRAYTYVVRGEDDETKGETRRRNWYVKGKAFTANVEVIERLKPGLDEDAVTKWHREGPCPEVEHVLASMVPPE